MTRRTFFSFKYKQDVSRAMVVRNSWVTQGKEAAGFVDTAEFEKIKKGGDKAIEIWIDNQLKGTSVTVILVGEKTCNSRWIKYEIEKSKEIGNGLLGIDISKIKDLDKHTSERCGKIPKGYDFYLWNNDDGYNNMGDWIEKAAKDAGR
ncbi:MAG: TIR domain-containing protein [Bacteroidetes bacterium]|nr:TIR domain-containing protein [Bacteroidota bacterium]